MGAGLRHIVAAGEPSGPDVEAKDPALRSARGGMPRRLRDGGRGHPERAAIGVHPHPEGRPSVRHLGDERAGATLRSDAQDLRLVHAPHVEDVFPGVVGDALGEQVGLGQLEGDPAGDEPGAVPLQPAGHVAVAGALPEGDEVGVRGEIRRIAQRREVPQRRDRPGGVTGECLRRREREGDAAVRGTERLGPAGVLQEGRQVLGLVGLDGRLVLAPRLYHRVGLGEGGTGHQKRGQQGDPQHGHGAWGVRGMWVSTLVRAHRHGGYSAGPGGALPRV